MAKGCALSTAYLSRGGFPRNSVDRITDRPDMTSAVDCGCKASTQTNKNKQNLVHRAGLPRSGKKVWKLKFFPGEGKVREFQV